MKASWIFTTNDVIANLGVIIAALLVYLFHSAVPDLVVAMTPRAWPWSDGQGRRQALSIRQFDVYTKTGPF